MVAKQRQPAWASVCKSACGGIGENPCSAEAVAVGKWSVGQVCDFVSEIDACKSFVEVRTRKALCETRYVQGYSYGQIHGLG